MLATATFAMAGLVHAGPTGGQVTAGSGNIQQAGNTTTVTQSSQNLSLTWQSFNTTAAETVNFVQPSASAIAVNRILDANPTQFMGKLNANGQVYLINPNGVLFGAGSQINVGGLVASTLDLSDASLNSGTRNFSGSGKGSIVNQGTITTSAGGYVAFIGNTVRNQGTITTPGGIVAMGAGNDVTLAFAGNSLVQMQVNQNTLENLAENGGLIRADGGMVVMSAGAKDALLASVVNNTGIIEARSVQNVNGTIVLGGGDHSTVTNSGTLDASGKNAGEKGGTIKVLGDDVTLAAGSTIDVSGDTGGGTAYIGGNFLGAGPERNARNTTVTAGSTINADAITSGNGGQVAVWSDEKTQFNGSISARGGQNSGNGGEVETSGKSLKIGGNAFVSTAAPHGAAGYWLLDPLDFTIAASGGDITGAQITAALQYTDVTIKTGNSISCTNVTCGSGASGGGNINIIGGELIGGVDWTSNTTLTLSAYRNINISDLSVIDASSGGGNIVLKADNTGTGLGTVFLENSGGIYSNNGNVNIYYNPIAYTQPTDFSSYVYFFGTGQLKAYMAINLNASIQNKTYDGNTTATLSSLSPFSTPSGVTVDTTGATASFNDKNAGLTKTVTVSGVTLTGANAGDYYLNGLDAKTATISKADLSLTGITANNKTYDGTQAATMAGTASVTAIGSDFVAVSGSGTGSTFDTKNVGTDKTVTVSGYSLSGTDAGNYNLVLPTNLKADITKANLNVSGITANNKTYDGTTAASLAGTATVSVFGSDVVAVTGTGTGTFSDRNAGANKSVTVTGYALSGTDANNYNIVQPTGLTATINKADLTVSGITAANKTYDGTTAATLAGTAAVTAIGSDVVSVTGTGTGAFANKNAGTNKSVTVSGYALSGTDANNYNIVQPTGLTATINKADLTVSGITAANKTYDGTTAATLAGTAAVTAIGSDVVSVTGTGTGTFDDKNAGANKSVTVTGYGLTGTDANNYNIVQPTGVTATINKADLTVSGITAVNKTYDGTTAATLAGTAAVAAFGSDVVSVTGTGSGTFGDKNAGANKSVTVTGYGLTGTDANNYNVIQPTGLTATINKADLALTGLSVSNKVYDGTTSASLGGIASVSPIGSDVVSLDGTGVAAFNNKNAGTNKAISITGYTLSGTDAGNYNVVAPTSLTADITPASLTVSGITANDKIFNGTTAATVNTSGLMLTGLIGSDMVTLTASTGHFSDAAVGSNKTVNLTNTFGGADAGNYLITDQMTTLASITPAPVVPTASTVPPQIQNIVTQVQSSVLPPQAAAQPQLLQASSTIAVSNGNEHEETGNPSNGHANNSLINTTIGSGPSAPNLQIQNGGMQLPTLATLTSE